MVFKRQNMDARIGACDMLPHRRTVVSGMLALGALTSRVAAQARRQIMATVPFPPGGSLDSLTRLLMQKIGEASGDTFIVENKAGANGAIGARAAIQGPPDGTSWLFGHDALLTANDALYVKQPGFDAATEMTAAAGLAVSPSILVVHPSFPAKTVQEFIEAGRKTEIQYASGGAGSAGHLTMEYFGKAAGLKLAHVPYKGGAPAMNDLVAGHVPAAFVAIGGAIGHVKAGKLRALAVSALKRISDVPDVPTVAESGFPGFEFVEMYFIYLNSKASSDTVARVEGQAQAALADPAIQARIRQLGMEPAGLTAREAQAWLASARAIKTKLIRDLGITPQ